MSQDIPGGNAVGNEMKSVQVMATLCPWNQTQVHLSGIGNVVSRYYQGRRNRGREGDCSPRGWGGALTGSTMNRWRPE